MFLVFYGLSFLILILMSINESDFDRTLSDIKSNPVFAFLLPLCGYGLIQFLRFTWWAISNKLKWLLRLYAVLSLLWIIYWFLECQGISFSLDEFTKAGEYPYYCVIHPWMIGQITVSEPYLGRDQVLKNVGSFPR